MKEKKAIKGVTGIAFLLDFLRENLPNYKEYEGEAIEYSNTIIELFASEPESQYSFLFMIYLAAKFPEALENYNNKLINS